MNTKHRAKSLITGCDMEELFTLKDFPIWMMAGTEENKDCYVDFQLEIGREDGFVQVATVIPPEILYKDSHFDTPSMVWREMYEIVAGKVKEHSREDDRILEIGGGVRDA